MNNYVVIYYLVPNERGETIEEKVLFKFDSYEDRHVYKDGSISANLEGVVPLTHNYPNYMEFKNGRWHYSFSEEMLALSFYTGDGDYMFEAEDDNAAKLIYEIGEY